MRVLVHCALSRKSRSPRSCHPTGLDGADQHYMLISLAQLLAQAILICDATERGGGWATPRHDITLCDGLSIMEVTLRLVPAWKVVAEGRNPRFILASRARTL